MFSVRRRGLCVTAALAGATLAGSLAAPAAAASAAPVAARGTDPTITIRVGGVRTAENGPPGPPAATGLGGVTFRVTPATPGQPDTCVSTAAGLCRLNVAANQAYRIAQTGTPGGWYANRSLAAGSASHVTPHAYDRLDVTVGNGNVTVPAAAANSSTSPTARGGTWALSTDDPALRDGCGRRIALLIDLSSSIRSNILPTYKAAARAFVESLRGTPSSIAIYTFGTSAPANNTNDANLVPPVPVATHAGVAELVSKIDGLTVPRNSGTNWDAGLWQIVRHNPIHHYQSTIILTDGDPTYYGPANDLGGRGNMTRFAEVENGVFSANALKDQGTSVLGVGIGSSSQGLRYTDNIRAISGPVENTDYFNTDFERLSKVLADLALRNCAGLDLTKTATPRTYTHAGERVTYTYKVTNTRYFELHDVRVTDDHVSGPVHCAPSRIAAGETATCTASYTITQADVDRGHVTNTAIATGKTPNDDDVSSRPADATVHVKQEAAIRLVKSAFPHAYSAPGQTITYKYRVANSGDVTLYDIRLVDNRLGAITCPRTVLAPGKSMTCTATHTTTQRDVRAGHIDNSATVTGYPRKGRPVTDTATAVVTAIQRPGIALVKSASPAAYHGAGKKITYTYRVTNTGNVTLHNITVTDDKIRGPIACPTSRLAPGKWMTCRAVHTTTKADVRAGHIRNVALAVGWPPRGAKVTARAQANVVARSLPVVPVTG
jgi:von Willebrand factor type A domain